jgi:hypothetical protein
MDLTTLAGEFATQRGASGGLYLGEPQVLQCLIDATRFYAGWQSLADPATVTLADITGMTALEASEWSIIAPLFRLYVERETALVLEASRGLGVEMIGRDSSTVAGDIQNAEAMLPQQAFVEEAFSIGLPEVTPV